MIDDDISDEQLMLMFRYGNRAAFELLFEKHRRGVYNFARRILGTEANAEDICQEVFLRMVSAAGSYEPSARFRTWLFTIVRNCCFSALRRRQPANLASDDAVPDLLSDDPAGPLEKAEQMTHIERAILALPVQQREAFLLRYRHEMDYAEIAELTGQPLGTVKSHIHRARLRLAEQMKGTLGAES